MSRTSGIDSTVIAQREWDESKHPRDPKGTETGGQFTDKQGEYNTKNFKDFPVFRVGDSVSVDGFEGVVTATRTQKRTRMISVDPTSVYSEEIKREYKIVTVTIQNAWGQSAKFVFGGLDYDIDLLKRIVK